VSARARVTGRIAQVSAHDAQDVERTLSALHAANVRVEDLEIGRADLEDVFLAIMQGGTPPAAPVEAGPVTAVLYLLIFGHVLEEHVQVYGQVRYTSFLIPGLVMMSVLQNAFANSSSSLIQSKITGNLVFLLVTPLSHRAWFVAYVGASMVRGLVVGLGVLLVTMWFAPLSLAQPLWSLVFALLGAGMLGSLG